MNPNFPLENEYWTSLLAAIQFHEVVEWFICLPHSTGLCFTPYKKRIVREMISKVWNKKRIMKISGNQQSQIQRVYTYCTFGSIGTKKFHLALILFFMNCEFCKYNKNVKVEIIWIYLKIQKLTSFSICIFGNLQTRKTRHIDLYLAFSDFLCIFMKISVFVHYLHRSTLCNILYGTQSFSWHIHTSYGGNFIS